MTPVEELLSVSRLINPKTASLLPEEGPSIVGLANVRVKLKLVPSFSPVIESKVIAGPGASGRAEALCE